MNKFSGISVVVAIIAAATLAGCPAPAPEETHSQLLTAGNAGSLEGKTIYFDADTSPVGYNRQVFSGLTALPVSPDANTIIDFADEDPAVVTLPVGSEVIYFDTQYDTIYVGSDGTVGFEASDKGNGSVTDFFSSKKVSLLPVDATDADSMVGWEVFSDSVVVTYEDVDGSTFQAEFFIAGAMDEDMAFSYPTIGGSTLAGLVGLSSGQLAGATQAEIDDFVGSYTGSDVSKPNTGSAS